MNCETPSRSGDHAMNHDFDQSGDHRGGDQDGGNGGGFRDHLTKEQLECLEETFFRFVSSEMKTNHTNWEEFYDLLNEACMADAPCLKKNSPSRGGNTDVKEKEGDALPNGYTGFKINTEATKQQYRTCDSSAKPPFCEQKQKNSRKDEGPAENKFNLKQNEKEFPRYKDKENNDKYDSPFTGKHCTSEIKNNSETFPKCTKNTKRKLSHNSRTTKSKTNQTEHKDGVDTSGANKQIPAVSSCDKYLTLDFLKCCANDYYIKFMVAVNYLNATAIWCWRKGKEILLVLLCVLLIVAVAIWKLVWFLLCVVCKTMLFLILWVLCKVVNFVYVVHLKYDLFGKVKCYISNGNDLLFFITGINLKSVFTRKKKEAPVDERDDNLLLPLPTSPEEAVEHLMQRTEDKPFKALCVTRESTNDEIKANYRKMALLVHPDKCFDNQADEAFKVLDSAFKTLTDPEKRSKLMEEEKRRKEWEEFTRRYSGFAEDFETMFNDLINSISCSKCQGKHKRTLVKDRTFYEARYCGDCHTKHSANDGDIWAENNLFGLNWTCYVCMDGEIYELTEWAECQNLRKTIPINCHRVVCRLGNQRPGTNGNKRRNKHSENMETKKPRKKRRQKGRKP